MDWILTTLKLTAEWCGTALLILALLVSGAVLLAMALALVLVLADWMRLLMA